jgi:tRNA-Thr(GGU) m(6)t(6)A37 methyltransferase TsaA
MRRAAAHAPPPLRCLLGRLLLSPPAAPRSHASRGAVASLSGAPQPQPQHSQKQPSLLAWRAAAAAAGSRLLLHASSCRAFRAGAPRCRGWEHRAAVAAGAAWTGDALTYVPVGVFEGPFRRRNGTPRQGSLAPRARGRIRLLGEALAHGAADALDGLAGYSHAILLFHFHANTPSRAASKVAPPRLGGARVGVFATRAPHRPNPIGLSVVRIEAVEGSVLHVSGADLLHGTPIIDIKPYVPSYDAHPAATLPDWLSGAADTAPQSVLWSPAARAGLDAAAPALRFLRGAEDAAAAVEDALRSELRSAYRRKSAAVGDAYGFFLDVLDVRCTFDDAARAVTITDVAVAPYEDDEAWDDDAEESAARAAFGSSGDGEDGVEADDALSPAVACDAARGVAAADAAVFRALLSCRGLAARVSDAGTALCRVNGVLLSAPVGAAHAGAAVTLRYDAATTTLHVRVAASAAAASRDDDDDAPAAAEYAHDAHALCVSSAKGYKPLRTLGMLLLRGPVPGGLAWLPRGQKLGVAALWAALDARPQLTHAQLAEWRAAADAEDALRSRNAEARV